MSWDETKEWVQLLDLKTVPVLYDGPFRSEDHLKGMYKKCFQGCEMEGFVVRLADSFHYRDFPNVVGKYVRAGHVQTHGHWMRSMVVPNILAIP